MNAAAKRWTRKQIEFDNFSLACIEGGNAQGETILFLHGWSVSTAPYRDCLNTLAEEYWVVAPDLPGFGRSPYTGSLSSYQSYANCILFLVDRLNLKQFQLIGHSFGGAVALALAAAVPQAVKSVIAIDSTGIPLICPKQIVKLRLAEFIRGGSQLRWKTLGKILMAFGDNLIFNRQHLIEGAHIALQEDIRPWLSEVKLPCLILWGERDRFTPIEIGYGLDEAIANSQLQLISKEYHEWCMMQPEKLLPIARKFFNSPPDRTKIDYESSKS